MRFELLGLLALVATSNAWASPEDLGPLTVEDWDAGRLSLDGVDISVHVYAPAGVEPRPLVTLMHGLQRSGAQHALLARTLASYGFVTLVPDMPCSLSSCDHEANARQLRALFLWGVQSGGDQGSRLFGKVDAERLGAVGHSWGGLASTLLATIDPSLDALVVLDPNDDEGAAADQATRVLVPSAHVMAANPGRCNGTWGDSVFPSTGTPHLRVRVTSSGHCDVESPTDVICTIGCGRGDSSTTPIFRRYAVAFLGCTLGRDPAFATWIGGSSFEADVSDGVLYDVDAEGLETLPCRTAEVPDAGAPDASLQDLGFATDALPADTAIIDAAIPDAIQSLDASSLDAGTSLDAAPSFGDASEVPAKVDESCSCNEMRRGDSSALWAFLLLLGMRRRR